ncbi:MAG: hypothetical protein A3J74_08525 [Elusimicrobia bacterium RIFCSPHIGHO2_02_FULL_57_9]|nr:MAG: hypothetical protein A3J74_08525 [Elusimicrobia bacterium RIFCSPHIGHO2_02_FULL_57_9]
MPPRYDWAPLQAALSAEQRKLIEDYLDQLLDYNGKVNLTAPTDPQNLLLRHVADGLAAVKVLKEHLSAPAPKILDLGCGGGFIGMTIKIAWPEASVTLLESLKRKYEFLNLAVMRSRLKGLRVLQGRAAGQPLLGEVGFDAVVERALAPLPQALRLALPLTAPGGYFLAYQSARPQQPLPGLIKSYPYRLPLETRDRHLVLFKK